MTVVVVHMDLYETRTLFGVFESREKWLEEIKPHLEQKGHKGPIVWNHIDIGLKTLTAEEIELNKFQEYL